MKPKKNLFVLIKSLTKSEKRYFKMYCALQKGIKNYIMLFDAIESQSECDESEIKDKFSNEKFVRQLSFTKNYLYKLILESLVAYKKNKSIEAHIMQSINECKVLLGRGLIKQYFEQLDCVLKISNEYERFNFSLQIIEMKNVYTKINPVSKHGELNSNEINKVLEHINNFHSYNKILCELISLYRQRGKIRSEEMESKINKIESLELLKTQSYASSFRAIENYYFIHQLIADFKCDDEGIYRNCSERLKIISKHPEPFADMQINLIHDILGYILSYYARTNDNKNFEQYMKMLDDTPVDNKSDKVSLFFIKTYVTNVKIIADQNWEEGIERIEAAKKSLQMYSDNLEGDIELLIRYQFVRIFIMAGKFTSALEEANTLLNHPRLKNRPEFEWCTRLLFIIIHYELRNYNLLKYLIISTYRYLYKKKNLFRLESLFLEFIKKLPGTSTQQSLKMLLSETKSELLLLKKDAFEKNAFRYFDFVKWIDMKQLTIMN